MNPRRPLLACFLTASVALAASTVKTAPGYSVEKIYSVPRESQGSWVALAPDGRGGLLASDQYGPLYRIAVPRTPGAEAKAERLPVAIGGVHGLTWVGRDLYAIAAQKSVHPTGLYRLRASTTAGELERPELLAAIEGDGEHGPHAVVPAPDSRSLYVLAGNATALPVLARSRVPPLGGDDALFPPLSSVLGSETRGRPAGGWIARTDLDGKNWELFAHGLRNAYALAVDPRGEVFTFDSDTEFEINLPWYRPTRVLHAVSGADFGWRRGVFKVPESAPDGWPAVLPLGLGSPTAVLFPHGARIPAAHRAALWVADWSYGRILALTLRPAGATFTATAEEIVTGVPLPVTALCVNPADGALYFATGGRRTQSALYRLSWNGDAARASEPALPTAAVATRESLENFHGRPDSAALATIWPVLRSADPILRRSARVALECQPVATWRDRALAETDPHAALAALLALARVEAKTHQPAILAALERHFDTAPRREIVRVLTLTFARGGELNESARAAWASRLTPWFTADSPARDVALLDLLIWLRAPSAFDLGFAALTRASTHEAQLDLARALRARATDWSPAQRTTYLTWLHRASTWRGGTSFNLFLKSLRDEAVARAPAAERAALEQSLAAAAKPAPITPLSSDRRTVRAWSVDEIVALVGKDRGPRNRAQGRAAFAAAGCFACHTVGGEGGALGPDLSAVGSRLAPRDLIEAIIEPSREISDQYGTVEVTLRSGRSHTGRIVSYTEQGLHLAENLLDPAQVLRLAEADIAAIVPSKISLMPPGLINGLEASEILDLLAFLTPEPPAP